MDNWEGLSWIGHSLSVGAIVGALVGVITPVATLIALVWYSVQLWESNTVQNMLQRRRQRKILALKMRLQELEDASHKRK